MFHVKKIVEDTTRQYHQEFEMSAHETSQDACKYIEQYFNGYFSDDTMDDAELFNASMKIVDTNSDNIVYTYIGSSMRADYSMASITAVKAVQNMVPTNITITLKVVRDVHHSLDLSSIDIILDKDAICPERAHDSDAGLDFFAPCFLIVPPHGRTAIDTGVHVDIPDGYVGKLESKSGLMRHSGITCRGTIDARYHGTIVPILFNNTDRSITFDRGDKITQMVIYPIATPMLNIVDDFDTESERGSDGFGSTGK